LSLTIYLLINLYKTKWSIVYLKNKYSWDGIITPPSNLRRIAYSVLMIFCELYLTLHGYIL